MLGPGASIYPSATDEVTVLAPVAGLVRTLHPHAFVLQVCEYTALLVHMGVDTFRIGHVFEPLVEEGRYLPSFTPITRWNIAQTVAAGFSPWVTVTAISSKGRPVTVDLTAEPGTEVSPGQELLRIVS